MFWGLVQVPLPVTGSSDPRTGTGDPPGRTPGRAAIGVPPSQAAGTRPVPVTLPVVGAGGGPGARVVPA